MRLLLCSAGLGALGPRLDQRPSGRRNVALVDAAARPLAQRGFVDDCRARLPAVGCQVTDLDLVGARRDQVRRHLDASDLVFVTGGYPVYLLACAQRSGFSEHVRTSVRSGTLDFVGVSAGAAPSVDRRRVVEVPAAER